MKLTELNAQIYIAILGAAITVSVALIGGMAAYSSAKRERRRMLYGNAYKAALAWSELLFRVRRRSTAPGADDALVKLFHEAQENINYHAGWIGSESVWMKRSYERLVKSIKTKTSNQISDAWRNPPISPEKFKGENLNLDTESKSFLFDVRCHLAWWQLPKIIVVIKNRVWLRWSE